MWSQYPILSGTVFGENKNEVYNRYGETIMEETRYGWHHEHIDKTTVKQYHLVPTDPVQYLITVVTYNYRKTPNLPDNFPASIDYRSPNTIQFEWVLASACDVPYTL